MLADWSDGSAIVVSCPGPLRRHAAALLPVAELVLPQTLLGSESQLLAFARHHTGLARLFFAPFPEMFPGTEALQAALARAGAADPGDVIHLRFGGVRAARVLKGARNAAVLAERAGPPLLTASHHPFATGRVLPAAMQRLYGLAPDVVRPASITGAALPLTVLPPTLATLPPAPNPALSATAGNGLDLTSLANFSSHAWAAGHPGGPPARPADGAATILVPWNMDHPGSIIPELLARFAALGAAPGVMPRLILLPFNYIGQTGIIRDLIKRVTAASDPAGTLLPSLSLARARSPAAIAALTRLSTVAWVDGNDPEAWWTLARLHAYAIACVLIAPEPSADTAAAILAPDEALWVEAATRCGSLIFPARMLSLRQLPALLDASLALRPPSDPPPYRPSRPRARRQTRTPA